MRRSRKGSRPCSVHCGRATDKEHRFGVHTAFFLPEVFFREVGSRDPVFTSDTLTSKDSSLQLSYKVRGDGYCFPHVSVSLAQLEYYHFSHPPPFLITSRK